MIGKTISHYRILEKLGEGGMGVVYKAQDTKLDRIVALKFLAPQALGEEKDRARFVLEAKAAASLSHSSICTVHEIDEGEGRTFIAMECVEGQPLNAAIKAGPFKLDELLDLAIQIAEGLQVAHEKGVVHRDIKPSNIMVTARGQVKILDFGLAKLADRTVLTKTGTTLGTVAYMSPEQGRGEKVDGRADIWSLGVMLYELVTGLRPFKGEYEPALVYSILNETPEPVTSLRTGVPMDLERLISKCMEKGPAERYQTAGDLVVDLRRVRRSLTDGTSGTSPAVRSEPTSRIGRLWLLGFGVLVIAISCWTAFRHFVPAEQEPVPARSKLVVLPFENLGEPEDGYFAAGVTEEITSRLASVRKLGVISRTSAVQYAKTDKTIRQIGDELGVEYVLEGTVRWARNPDGSDRVRITPQLIRVDDDTHLWADTYDRVIEDILTIQSDIAQRVVEQLGITLLDAERSAVENQPTDNLDAYHAYLRGRYYAEQPHFTMESWERAIENYRLAVELDPNFAMAQAELSKAHARLYYYHHDMSAERKRLAKLAMEKALELAPDSPEVLLAAGYFYFWVEKDFELAIEYFDLSAIHNPENADVLDAKAAMLRHQGHWQEALVHYQRACELSPRDADHFMELAITKWWLRQYSEAMAVSEEAIALAPDQAWPYLTKIFIYWSWNGALEDARSAFEKLPEGHIWASWTWYWQRIYEGDYQEAVEGLSSTPGDWIKLKIGAWPKSLFVAYAHQLMGETNLARTEYENAKTALEEEVLATPDDPRYHSSLGVACAFLGQKERAIEEGRKAVSLYPISKDAAYGIPYAIDLAHIYTIVGEHEAALEELEYLLSIPGWISVSYLEIDPRWDPLRDEARFQRLVSKYSGRQS